MIKKADDALNIYQQQTKKQTEKKKAEKKKAEKKQTGKKQTGKKQTEKKASTRNKRATLTLSVNRVQTVFQKLGQEEFDSDAYVYLTGILEGLCMKTMVECAKIFELFVQNRMTVQVHDITNFDVIKDVIC